VPSTKLSSLASPDLWEVEIAANTTINIQREDASEYFFMESPMTLLLEKRGLKGGSFG
jgi:hypothetical protein